MIEHQQVNGRPATVAYLDNHFEPVSKANAKLVKLMFDDGDTYFLVRPAHEHKDANPYHDPHTGKFASGPGEDNRKDWKLEDEQNPGKLEFDSVREAQARGAFDFKQGKYSEAWGDKTQTVMVKPNDIPAHWDSAQRRDEGAFTYFDPKYAEKYDMGEGVEGIKPGTLMGVRPKGVSEGLPTRATEGSIYRGMSYEEYAAAKQSGYFESRGGYNLGETQHGLTFYSTDPQQAEAYANGFAPWMYKATPSRPAVVVEIADPGGHAEVPGLGRTTTEVGIRGRVPMDSVRNVWLGHPYIVREGEFDVRRTLGRTKMGGGSSYGASVRWKPEGRAADAWGPAAWAASAAARAKSGAQQATEKTKGSFKEFAKGPVGSFLMQHGGDVVNNVVSAAGQKLHDPEVQKELLAGAVTASLYHLAGVDFPMDVEAHLHHEVVNFATNARVSVGMARQMMKNTVNGLIAKRGGGKAKDSMADADDPVMKVLLGLKHVLENSKMLDETEKKEKQKRDE